MIENNQNVGADAQAGAGSTPSEPVSTPAQPPIDGNVAQLLAGFGEKFNNLEAQLRGLQGRQDKAENNFQAQLAKFNQIKSQGNLSDEQAMEVMQRNDAEAQRWQNLESKLNDLAARIAGGGTQANGQQVNAAEVFGKILGQDNVKNPLLAPYLAKQYASVAEAESAAKMLFYDLSNLPNPTNAQAASLQGGNAGPTGAQAKIERLAQLQQRPSQHMAEIAQLTKELEASGWK